MSATKHVCIILSGDPAQNQCGPLKNVCLLCFFPVGLTIVLSWLILGVCTENQYLIFARVTAKAPIVTVGLCLRPGLTP
jgi:hypothetical protein